MPSELGPRTRREILAGLACAALAPIEARTNAYNPKLVAQTYVWLLEMQFRNRALEEGLEDIFTGTRRAGYRRLELMPALVESKLREKTIALLAANRLEPTIVYASGPVHERDAGEKTRAQVLETAAAMKAAGTGFVNFSPAAKPGEQRKADEELETQAYQLNRMGDELQKGGIQLLLHHHLPEMRDNAREWRYCLRRTETGLVRFCLDVDWASRAGMDPLALMDEAGGRLASLHLRNTRNGVSQEVLGDGDINMAKIATFLQQTFYGGFLVVELIHEKDTRRAHSLPTDLSLSRLYMQKVFSEQPGSTPVDFGPHVRTKEL
ncbi:MAG TPA: sugar phosphate isomerase/epimerase [Bryobacteraceae bacterium]|nr:sugar phosphate isomerase/epimerase [Bryobacteraceae bacterium]